MPHKFLQAILSTPRSLVLAAFFISSGGCASPATHEDGCTANCSDASISAAVRGRLFHEASLPSAYISVSTVNGVVYLHGAVVTSVERDAAVSAASQVAGVVRVVNSIEIGGDE